MGGTHPTLMLSCYRPQMKLREGNVLPMFVCLRGPRGGGGGMRSRGCGGAMCMAREGSMCGMGGERVRAKETATEADGTHPTGMHFFILAFKYITI